MPTSEDGWQSVDRSFGRATRGDGLEFRLSDSSLKLDAPFTTLQLVTIRV